MGDLASCSGAPPSFLIGVSMFYWRRCSAPHFKSRKKRRRCISYRWMAIAMTMGLPDIASLALVYVVAASAIASDLQGSVAFKLSGGLAGSFGQLTYSMYMWHSILITVVLDQPITQQSCWQAGTGLMLAVGAVCDASILACYSDLSYVFV